MAERVFPDVRVRIASPNYSHRTTGIHGIVIHAAVMHNVPGVKDLASLGNYFHHSSSEVSSHSACDNGGHSARFVVDHLKAWHCAGFNSQMLGLEQIIPGDGREITQALYEEAARWCALWSREHGIPLQRGIVRGARIVRPGVFSHKQLGSVGGGHVDPGPHYSMDHVIKLARRYKKLQNRRHRHG